MNKIEIAYKKTSSAGTLEVSSLSPNNSNIDKETNYELY